MKYFKMNYIQIIKKVKTLYYYDISIADLIVIIKTPEWISRVLGTYIYVIIIWSEHLN